MAFTVRITFTDLCAFFERSAKELIVLLVDARNPTPEQEAAGMQSHQPVLCISPRNLSKDPTNRRPDRLVPTIGGDNLALFELSREELSFATPSTLDVARYPITTASPLSSFDEQSLGWLAPLGALGFSLNTLVDEALGNLSSGPVVARVKITGGRVICSRVVQNEEGYRLFDLRSAPGAQQVGGSRALGDLVQVEVTIPSVEGHGGPQVVSSPGRSIAIVPASGSSPVELLIGNMTFDPELIFLNGSSAPHFRWFYELLRVPPPLLGRVIPFDSSPGALTGSSPHTCFMGEFS